MEYSVIVILVITDITSIISLLLLLEMSIVFLILMMSFLFVLFFVTQQLVIDDFELLTVFFRLEWKVDYTNESQNHIDYGFNQHHLIELVVS